MLAPRRCLWSSPDDAVRAALELLDPLCPEDRVVDLGCGDGRFVIEAAKRAQCCCLGVEIDEDRAEKARENVRREGLEALVEIRCENALSTSVEDADVIYLYLIPRGLGLLAPRLLGRKRRIVSYMAPIPGLTHTKKVTCSPAHQPGAAWPLYAYEINENTELNH